jgi:inorganic pyrophosphatase
MTDEGGEDAKLLAVPVDKLTPLYKDVKTHEDMPELLRKQISHFFEHYKDLEPGKWVKVNGWEGIEAAKNEIMKASSVTTTRKTSRLTNRHAAYRRCPVQRHRR